MGSIGRYIFRTTFGAFLLVLVSVTALMWFTQALRNIDFITDKGQSLLVFVGITSLLIPLLLMLTAPIALMIATAHVLNKLSNDSELVVMNAAGMPPAQVLRAFLAVGIVVTIMVGALSLYLSPLSLRTVRQWTTEIRADLINFVLMPGRFTQIEPNLTLHIRARQSDGQLLGLLVDDQRDPKERVTILADRGEILKNERGMFLIFSSGTVQRRENAGGKNDPAIVSFDRYAFDLSRFSSQNQDIKYSIQERPLRDLFDPPQGDRFPISPNTLWAELNNRISTTFYPLSFLLVTFAFLGAPRTTRQSRALSLVGAICVVSLLRLIGFVGTLRGAQIPALLALPYLAIGAAIVLSWIAIARGVVIEPPEFIVKAVNSTTEAIARSSSRLLGQAS